MRQGWASMINVLIVDDHALIREGVKKTLFGEPDMAVVGSANSVAELFKQLEQLAVSLVLLDITMPGESGLDALKELHQKYPRLPVLILTFHPEHRFAVRALKAGASGYITKESATEYFWAGKPALFGYRLHRSAAFQSTGSSFSSTRSQ